MGSRPTREPRSSIFGTLTLPSYPTAIGEEVSHAPSKSGVGRAFVYAINSGNVVHLMPEVGPSGVEDGLVSIELLMTEDDLSIVIEPRMGVQPSIVTRNSDSNLRFGSPPPEEPGKDQGFFQAGCCDGGVSAGDLYQPSQMWNRGNQPQGRLAFSLEEHFLREA